MALLAKESGGGPRMDPVPEGIHIAVCYGLVDLGTHYSPIYEKRAHKILIQWELPDCRGNFERDGARVDLPRAISQRYTLSLHEKSQLRAHLEAWRGKKFTAQELTGFDVKAVLGTACQLQVLHETKNEKTYANITSIMALPRSVPVPVLENPKAFFAFDDPESIDLARLPQWVRDEVMKSDEATGKTSQPPAPVAPPARPAPAAPPSASTPPIKPAHIASQGPSQASQVDVSGREPFWNVVCPVPRQGQTRADYMTNPDTIGSLYEGTKEGDEVCQRRLWGFVSHFQPKPWIGKDGMERPPGPADLDFRLALDAFKLWHDSQPKDAPKTAPASQEPAKAGFTEPEWDDPDCNDIPF